MPRQKIDHMGESTVTLSTEARVTFPHVDHQHWSNDFFTLVFTRAVFFGCIWATEGRVWAQVEARGGGYCSHCIDCRCQIPLHAVLEWLRSPLSPSKKRVLGVWHTLLAFGVLVRIVTATPSPCMYHRTPVMIRRGRWPNPARGLYSPRLLRRAQLTVGSASL